MFPKRLSCVRVCYVCALTLRALLLLFVQGIEAQTDNGKTQNSGSKQNSVHSSPLIVKNRLAAAHMMPTSKEVAEPTNSPLKMVTIDIFSSQPIAHARSFFVFSFVIFSLFVS